VVARCPSVAARAASPTWIVGVTPRSRAASATTARAASARAAASSRKSNGSTIAMGDVPRAASGLGPAARVAAPSRAGTTDGTSSARRSPSVNVRFPGATTLRGGAASSSSSVASRGSGVRQPIRSFMPADIDRRPERLRPPRTIPMTFPRARRGGGRSWGRLAPRRSRRITDRANTGEPGAVRTARVGCGITPRAGAGVGGTIAGWGTSSSSASATRRRFASWRWGPGMMRRQPACTGR
jgi:hypothetical protein